MDFNYDEYYRITQKERFYSNKQLERFMDKAREYSATAQHCLGKKNLRSGLYQIQGMPHDIRHHQYGSFDSELALARTDIEFLAFGHPIVDGVINDCRHSGFGGTAGIVSLSEPIFNGFVFYYLITFNSVSPVNEFIPIAVDHNNIASDSLCRLVERECSRNAPQSVDDHEVFQEKIVLASSDVDELFARARVRLEEKIHDRIMLMRENLDLSIDPEIDKIRDSFTRLIDELGSKLERQELQMIHFGRDMKGAIGRTKNRIAEAVRERDSSLALNRKRLGLDYSIELVGIGLLSHQEGSSKN
jgi:hypothetical protein